MELKGALSLFLETLMLRVLIATLGGASSDPPESQDTVTCRLDSILIRSSCCSFSSSSIVLRKTYSISVKLLFDLLQTPPQGSHISQTNQYYSTE